MTTLHKAAQQALEVLERAGEELRWQAIGQVQRDLRAALAQQAGSWQDGVLEGHLRERERWLAQPASEPVAWRYKPMIGSLWSMSDDGYYVSCKRDKGYIVEPLYTAPPQRKPLAEWQITDLMADIDPEDVCSWSFRQGAYAAEKHHGIRP